MKIIAAAVQVPSAEGLVNLVMYPPYHHGDILHEYFLMTGKRLFGEQGFIDSKENFHSRESAAQLALEAGQVQVGRANVRHEFNGRQLFSEDLW